MEREKELLELIWYRCLDSEHQDEVPEDIIDIMKKYAAESGFDLPDDR